MRFPNPLRATPAICAAACLLSCVALPAMADGQPLILDTRTGINDGQSGIVLQNAPLSSSPMVQAQPTASPAQLDQSNAQPPVIVAPYIELPAAGTSTPHTLYRLRSNSTQ
ncbi:MAG TPA: hypothetical protein VGZ01_06160 [Trinickia sp.]|jgi:hypothetical protein|nr:hypothetical protein [Trinickia sp.]